MEARCVLRHANCLRSQRLLTILLRGRDERQPRGRDGAQSLYPVQLSVLTALNPQARSQALHRAGSLEPTGERLASLPSFVEKLNR